MRSGSRALYVARLGLQDHQQRLGRDLAGEEHYRDLFWAAATRARGLPLERVKELYGGWEAFCGGGHELARTVLAAAGAVADAARETGADVPDFHAGPWPSPAMNAASRATDYGNVVYVNTALLFAARGFAQQVLSCIPEMLAGDLEGPVWRRARAELDQMWQRHLDGDDVRGAFPIRPPGDPELEQFRRDVVYGATCYVVAHEVGHLARARPGPGGWTHDNREFQVQALLDDQGALQPPRTEHDVTNSVMAETHADAIACAILRREGFFRSASPDSRLAFILGAMSIPALQGAAWWRRAARTVDPLGWTHPAWDMRLAQVCTELAHPEGTVGQDLTAARADVTRDPTELETNAAAARGWIEGLLQVPPVRQEALQRGLKDRGLNPMTLAFLYAAHGLPQATGDG